MSAKHAEALAEALIDTMIEVASNDSGKFRDVVPKAVEEMLKESRAAAWTRTV